MWFSFAHNADTRAHAVTPSSVGDPDQTAQLGHGVQGLDHHVPIHGVHFMDNSPYFSFTLLSHRPDLSVTGHFGHEPSPHQVPVSASSG